MDFVQVRIIFASFQTLTVVEKHSHLHKTVLYIGNIANTNKILQAKRVHFTTVMKPVSYCNLLNSYVSWKRLEKNLLYNIQGTHF